MMKHNKHLQNRKLKKHIVFVLYNILKEFISAIFYNNV
ncbi:hypothetical protein TREAZ_0877 [Leadbettera azotonutricia ZAS-9]|uniref:Uncharacterized protein n=1 Tax=Leadbettera azotonutricia (strain ATCC BAA-888 / DSM 13862 / ZAS-9) TaxID=545695 RepID=F5Y905_LEAAZ|nr:hypothetical protein TREAZ_0877 [Leadbettera azotonutricia ZAS-9]